MRKWPHESSCMTSTVLVHSTCGAQSTQHNPVAPAAQAVKVLKAHEASMSEHFSAWAAQRGAAVAAAGRAAAASKRAHEAYLDRLEQEAHQRSETAFAAWHAAKVAGKPRDMLPEHSAAPALPFGLRNQIRTPKFVNVHVDASTGMVRPFLAPGTVGLFASGAQMSSAEGYFSHTHARGPEQHL